MPAQRPRGLRAAGGRAALGGRDYKICAVLSEPQPEPGRGPRAGLEGYSAADSSAD